MDNPTLYHCINHFQNSNVSSTCCLSRYSGRVTTVTYRGAIFNIQSNIQWSGRDGRYRYYCYYCSAIGLSSAHRTVGEEPSNLQLIEYRLWRRGPRRRCRPLSRYLNQYGAIRVICSNSCLVSVHLISQAAAPDRETAVTFVRWFERGICCTYSTILD